MKKIGFLILITLFAAVFAINAYAGNSLKLFYNGKFFSLSQEIISIGDEYFVNAKELSAVIGTRCKIDASNKNLSLEIDNSVKNYEIKSYDYTIIEPSSITHNLPELINNKVYFPFSFITEKYGVIVKYDNKSNYLYFFQDDSKINTLINNNCKYNLTVPDSLYLNFGESHNFDTSSIYLTNEDHTFSASIVCDIINTPAINNMRFLLSDYVSPESYIFNRIVEYKHSYFRSLLDSYKNEFLFGNLDSSLSESNIKIIKEDTEELFGQNSNIVVFNIISSQKHLSQEDINIILTIPSYVNRSIYTIAFTMDKGHLDNTNINNIVQLLRGLSITNHPLQENLPHILLDSSLIKTANSGVYPILPASEVKYIDLEDSANYYKIRYPSNFFPYLCNNFIDNHSYRSFKIDHNTYISISVEHISGNPYRILEKINSLKSYYGDKIKIIRIESQNINGKEFIFLNYEKENHNNGTKEYVTNYFIINGVRLYTLELNSMVSPASEHISYEFLRIVSSFEFTKAENSTINSDISFVKFSNDRSGYSIFYPDNWSFQDNSQDINYDSFEITNPNYSGPLNIVINESEYTSELTTTELLKYTTGYDTERLSKYFKNYIAPYSGKTHKVLTSSVQSYNNFTIIYKLVNYLDEGDRYKLCYSIDLVRNNRINSLYISASEYLFQENVLVDKDLYYILDFMIESFFTSDNQKYLKIQNSSEKRNNKIVFIENFFKKTLGESTTVTYAKNLNSEKDVLVYINNSNKAGAYKLVFDYNQRIIQVSSRVLQPDIEKSAYEKIRSIFQSKTIHDVAFDWDSMTVSVKYSDTKTSPAQIKEYYLEVIPAKKEFSVNFIRKLNAENIKDNCQSFLENYFLTNVQVHFPMNYSFSNENWNRYAHEKCQIPVYAESEGQSGYFFLEVDPVSDTITILKYISTNEIKQRIEDYYFTIDPTINVLNYQPDTFDKFRFIVSTSSASNAISTQEIHTYYDEKSQDLLFSNKDLYSSRTLTK